MKDYEKHRPTNTDRTKNYRLRNSSVNYCITFYLEFMKTDAQKLEQVERILKLFRKRGQNNEYYNSLYLKLSDKVRFGK
jgi:hypothetical protein